MKAVEAVHKESAPQKLQDKLYKTPSFQRFIMAEDDQIQQKYMQFKALQQQLQQIQEYQEALHTQQQELENSINGIRELAKVTVETEILAPIANGIFVKTKLKDNQQLIVNVGANVTVEKSLPEVINLLEQQNKELQEKIPMAEAVLQELQGQIQRAYEELKEVSEKE
jgi:prefoldin alpha subunit